MFVCLLICSPCVQVPEKAISAPELNLQALMNHLTWIWGAKPRSSSSTRAVNDGNH